MFSNADVDFLVNLVLSGEWKDVEFYIQFLISHYEQFLNSDNKISNIIVEKLYELLVKVKTQKFYEALEFNDYETAIVILTKEITGLSKHLPPLHFKHMQKLFNHREAFRELKIELASGTIGGQDESCVKYRNVVATDVREQLNELLNMYGSMSSMSTKVKASTNINHFFGGSSSGTDRAPTVVEEARGWKRKAGSLESESEPEFELAARSPVKRVPDICFSPHPSNLEFIPEPPVEKPIVKKRKVDRAQQGLSYIKKSPTSAAPAIPPSDNAATSSAPQKLGNMDVLLEAFDIMAHSPKETTTPTFKQTKTAFQPFHETAALKSSKASKPPKPRQPKLDAAVEQKITDSLDFQSIKPTKTIKPVRKLCTGGITSTPAIRERMIKVLEQYKTPVTWETIQHKVSGNRAKVWATLCMFVNEGLVTQTGKGRRGHPYKYVMKNGVTVDSVQGEIEDKFKKLDYEAMKLHRQYREKQQEEIQIQKQQEYFNGVPQAPVRSQQPLASTQPISTATITSSHILPGFTPQQHPDVPKLVSPDQLNAFRPARTLSPPQQFRSFTSFDSIIPQAHRNRSIGYSGSTTAATVMSSPAH